MAVGPARTVAGRVAYTLSAHMYKPDDDRLLPVAAADTANATNHVNVRPVTSQKWCFPQMLVISSAASALCCGLCASLFLGQDAKRISVHRSQKGGEYDRPKCEEYGRVRNAYVIAGVARVYHV
jgi:hypothetical protein